MVTSRECTKCGHEKDLSEFAKSARGKFGRQSRCRECQREDRAATAEANRARTSAWYAANKDWARERERVYREANAERIAARKKAWNEANADRIREQKRKLQQEFGAERYARRRDENRAYQLANPHIWWRDLYRRRAQRFGFSPVVEDFTKADMIDRYGDACAYCETGDFEQLDHHVPVSKGGPHTLNNVRPSCARCNNSKGSTEPEDFEAADLDYDRRTR